MPLTFGRTVRRWQKRTAAIFHISACIAVSFLLTGCLMTSGVSDPAGQQALLLDGEALFGETVSADEIPEENVLGLTDDMTTFLDEQIGSARIPAVRFRKMFAGLERDGHFTSTYVADTTRTASETFREKSGNCLSYTNMFVALSRGAGLDARFQIVKVPPSWDADSGYLIRYTHINVLMKGFVFDTRYGQDFSVDFNDVLPDPEHPKYEISDAEALSLFYANRSVTLMRDEKLRAAFAHLKKAIQIAPDNANLWINLGALYGKEDLFEHAVQAYELALYYDPGNRSAISGLGRAHDLNGNAEEAERYLAQDRRYREKNPFYHYAIAQAEYDRARYDEALVAINSALDLKYRSGRFHFLKGLTEKKLGEVDAAEESFQRATRYRDYRRLSASQRYAQGESYQPYDG